jgi:uncharacterized protein
MKKLSPSDMIYLKDSNIENAGRGIFAARDIKENELIEKCPIIEIPEDNPSNLNEGLLITYFYYFGKKMKRQAIALGFGSIYNHTRQPNALYKIKQKEGTIEFIALKNIKKDDEITVNYNYSNPDDKTPLWFEAV